MLQGETFPAIILQGCGLCIRKKKRLIYTSGTLRGFLSQKILQVVPDSLGQNLWSCLEDDIQEVGERVSALFPYNIEIRPPEDESQLLIWKNDMKMVQFRDNKNKKYPSWTSLHLSRDISVCACLLP
ncbi:hypothetical protein Bca4012_083153 [Brassica carinata]|uniref:Uncharacterized protein n=1 Tax=Brassica carinata TaxID=52824 RepID=A0A8X8ALK1_BRACI|nr:hypothetical protein Bca52824_027618 [Brassica carinata]